MGDELISAVMDELKSVIFANRFNEGDVRPIVDAIVNKLRNAGMSDETIRAFLCDECVTSYPPPTQEGKA